MTATFTARRARHPRASGGGATDPSRSTGVGDRRVVGQTTSVPAGRPARALPDLDDEELTPELRENPIVRFLLTMTPAEAARLEEARQIDLEGPPPGFGVDDFGDEE